MPHPSPVGQVPQLTVPPQPSPSAPHSLPPQTSAASAGTQSSVNALQTLSLTMPHAEPSAQVPHSSRAPQPSATEPQSLPRASQVVGWQPPEPLEPPSSIRSPP